MAVFTEGVRRAWPVPSVVVQMAVFPSASSGGHEVLAAVTRSSGGRYLRRWYSPSAASVSRLVRVAEANRRACVLGDLGAGA